MAQSSQHLTRCVGRQARSTTSGENLTGTVPNRPVREHQTSLRLTADQAAKADRLAGKLAVTRSEAIRRMIDHYPDKETR
jgi:hypothetical protein